MPGIVFRFPIVDSRDSDCDLLTIRDGSNVIRYQACLDEIDMSPQGVFVPSENGALVEFSTDDWQNYGFILKFESGMLIVIKGSVRISGYPDARCQTNHICR